MEKNYKNCSMADCAFGILSNSEGEISFKDLFEEVCRLQEIPEDKRGDLIADLFTSLNLDGRFAVLKNNMVDLRSRRKYDEIKVDMQSLYDAEEASEGSSDDLSDDDDEDENKEDDDEDALNGESSEESNY